MKRSTFPIAANNKGAAVLTMHVAETLKKICDLLQV